jgi:hypothetical protein
MKRRTVKTLLERLDKCNARLSGFMDKAGKIQDEVPGSRIKIKFVAPLECIQGNASKVHRVLFRSWCDTHPMHRAGLLLEQRLVRRKRKMWKGPPQKAGECDCFGVSLLRVPVLTWIDTEFRVDDSNMQSSRYGNLPIASLKPLVCD